MQKNLEDVKNELKFLLPKVSNEDGVAQLNSIISSIQEAQNRADDYERNSVYEDPYSNQPNLYDEQKQTFDKYGLPDNDLIRKSGGSWLQGQVSHRWGPRMTLKQAVSGWRE